MSVGVCLGVVPKQTPVKGQAKFPRRGRRLLLEFESQVPVAAWEKNGRKEDVKCQIQRKGQQSFW